MISTESWLKNTPNTITVKLKYDSIYFLLFHLLLNWNRSHSSPRRRGWLEKRLSPWRGWLGKRLSPRRSWLGKRLSPRRGWFKKRPSRANEGSPPCTLVCKQHPKCPLKNIWCEYSIEKENVVPTRIFHIWISSACPWHNQLCKVLHWTSRCMNLTRECIYQL